MFACCGVSNYVGSFFHLFNHAFFKALLFLCAGSIIHAIGGRQDLRKFNYLFYFLPVTYISLVFAVLSLIGFPFMSGFYSKDALIEFTTMNNFSTNFLLFFISSCAVLFTVFYNVRMLYLIF
jgi:NADH-ubiquinone oxidoreductase chain 5